MSQPTLTPEQIAAQVKTIKETFGYSIDYMADQHRQWHTFRIADEYKWVLLIVLLHAFFFLLLQCLGTVFIRRELFDQEWMKNNFGEAHLEATGREITAGGAGDMGDGRYTMQKGYAGWFEMSKRIRIFANWQENFG